MTGERCVTIMRGIDAELTFLATFYRIDRLWVRYFVLVGEQIISNIKSPGDLKGDLIEAWQKSLLLLQVMSAMERQGRLAQPEEPPFRVVHAAASVDCPRCVRHWFRHYTFSWPRWT